MENILAHRFLQWDPSIETALVKMVNVVPKKTEFEEKNSDAENFERLMVETLYTGEISH